ncbi:MAG: anthranilate phosphoribosyltransferase [Anaerolineae bacterium]
MIKEAIAALVEGHNLSAADAETVMREIMDGEASQAQIGAFLTALRIKGETIDEIAGCARGMRSLAVPVRPKRTDLVDTCGTGGDRSGTFNISTTAAFVVAGAGLGVAKHGNRSVSSQSGSADVLQALGLNLDLDAHAVADSIDTVGFGFLFAPKLHPAMRYAIGPRREMGIRTVFNLLGPLTNPAGAKTQVMGIYAAHLTVPLAEVLQALGSHSAYVVHGADGLDELSTTGPNRAAVFDATGGGEVVEKTLDAMSLGLPRATLAELRGGTATENADLTRRVLAGERGPRRDVVLFNAAAALVAGRKAKDLSDGLAAATDAIDCGAAAQVLARAVEFSNDHAPHPA